MSRMMDQLRRRQEDRGLMAALRCILIKNKKHRAWPALHRLGVVIDDGRSPLPFIAGLYAKHPKETNSGNFGDTCKTIQKRRDEKDGEDNKLTPTERRFQHLLAATDRNELKNRVLRMALMAKAQDVPINFEQLANDMKYWNDRTKIEWASSFWAQGKASEEEETS